MAMFRRMEKPARAPQDEAPRPATTSAPQSRQPAAEKAEDDIHPPPPVGWSETRIAVAERLFGSGLVAPSDPAYMEKLVAPLRLMPGMTVMEIGAGLGGNARIVAAKTGASVIGLESDPILAQVGMRRSTDAGQAESAPVRPFTPPDLGLDPGSIDAAYARQTFFRIAEKEALYRAIFRALRTGGDLLFTELMMVKPQSTNPDLARWQTAEQATPWTLSQTTSCLGEIGFDVRVTAEVTDELRRLILGAWARFAQDLTGGLDRSTAMNILAEGELWLRRLGLIDSGDLVAYRVLARKGSAGGESEP